MKFFLLIPVFAIFLSNIPFKMEMPVPAVDAKAACDVKKQEEIHCSEDRASQKEESCCKKETSCCICFVGFQVLAPVQNISKFDFQLAAEKPLDGLFLQPTWIDPFIDGPLQPPDVA